MQSETLYQELARGAEFVSKLLAGITPAEARVKPDPESWSMLEVVCHLHDEERLDFWPRLDIMLHRPREAWPPIDPGGWVTAHQYNERELAQALDGFLAERARSLAWLQGLPAPNWEAEYAAPWGLMKAGDMLASWVAHDHLHTRQLVELKRARIVSLARPYGVRYAGEW